MRLTRRQILPALGAVALPLPASLAGAARDEAIRYRATTRRAYDDVLADIEFTIIENNFRITGGNHIGAAIAERLPPGADFPRSDIVLFCNLEYARELLQVSPDYLLYMPCKVVMQHYGNGEIVVETWLLPDTRAAARATVDTVNRILTAIVDYASE